ncbi:hypothetical protein AVEN_259448-1 [Araneus ventricosus]|uniref:Uncharacterized protein n=1 Tax=Araneus ventricosus TaxID=182803 RepID=A0A4Y2R893_ARAVE|nr:hypothetical protein AVEN_259448-1 [Araneus ventricosus]
MQEMGCGCVVKWIYGAGSPAISEAHSLLKEAQALIRPAFVLLRNFRHSGSTPASLRNVRGLTHRCCEQNFEENLFSSLDSKGRT